MHEEDDVHYIDFKPATGVTGAPPYQPTPAGDPMDSLAMRRGTEPSKEQEKVKRGAQPPQRKDQVNRGAEPQKIET